MSEVQQQDTWMERLKTGLVDFDAEKARLVERGIILRGAGADEAPPSIGGYDRCWTLTLDP
jgi:hypothetical protein